MAETIVGRSPGALPGHTVAAGGARAFSAAHQAAQRNRRRRRLPPPAAAGATCAHPPHCARAAPPQGVVELGRAGRQAARAAPLGEMQSMPDGIVLPPGAQLLDPLFWRARLVPALVRRACPCACPCPEALNPSPAWMHQRILPQRPPAARPRLPRHCVEGYGRTSCSVRWRGCTPPHPAVHSPPFSGVIQHRPHLGSTRWVCRVARPPCGARQGFLLHKVANYWNGLIDCV